MTFDEFLSNVDKDQIKAAVASGNPSELMGLMQAEGVELTDEQLEGIAGGKFEISSSLIKLFGGDESFRQFLDSLACVLAFF